MKRIDIITVLISSTTLVLFCLCSYWLLSQYSQIQNEINAKTESEIKLIEQTIEQLQRMQTIDRDALSDQLTSSKRALVAHSHEWQLLQQILLSFVAIMIIIVISHLFFVYTLFKAKRKHS